MILVEGHGIGHFIRLAVKVRRAAELGDQQGKFRMKRRDRHFSQRKRGLPSVAARARHHMIMKVEHDLDARTVRDQRGCQAGRGDIESGIPGMIEPRCMGQSVLADDLQVEMQGGTSFTPAKIVEGRPFAAHFDFPIMLRGNVLNFGSDQ